MKYVSECKCKCTRHLWYVLHRGTIRNTYIVNQQSLHKMTTKMLIVKIVGKETKDFRRANVNIAILKIYISISDICALIDKS